jgi:hypothetical protein
VWRAIGVAFKGDGGNGDDRPFGEPLFKVVIFSLAIGQAEPPTVIMDDDADVIRVVKGRRAAVERRVIEVPFWRSEPPNELVEIVIVFFVACAAAFRRKITLVLLLFGYGLGVRFSIRIKEFLAALLPRRFEFGR